MLTKKISRVLGTLTVIALMGFAWQTFGSTFELAKNEERKNRDKKELIEPEDPENPEKVENSGKNNEAKLLPIENIIKEYKALNASIDQFFKDRNINDVEKFKKENDRATLEKVNNELQEYIKAKSHEAYSRMFTEGGVYKIAGNCAAVITDVRYDESMISEDGPPPITDISISVICKNEKDEPIGTLTFLVVASEPVQQKVNNTDFTVIGDISIQLLQSSARFDEYIRDGVMTGTTIQIKPLGEDKINWFPSFREKNGGIMTVYGELIDLGVKMEKAQ